MNRLILADAQLRPRLFRWNGPLDPRKLAAWVQDRGWVLPPDLMELWALTGGGEVFESEMLVRPLLPGDDEDGVECATHSWLTRGMPTGLVVFHEGFAVSAVRCEDGAYFVLNTEMSTTHVYQSLDEWYAHLIRAEFWERYGLPPLQGAS